MGQGRRPPRTDHPRPHRRTPRLHLPLRQRLPDQPSYRSPHDARRPRPHHRNGDPRHRRPPPPFLRRPIQAAQSLASLDLLSGGRLTLAVGAGYPGRFGRPFYDLSEVPWARRFARLDETVALWRALWQGTDTFHGEFHHFTDIPPALRPYRPGGPPIWLGGATPTALTRTGRLYDGWLPYPPDPADYTTGLHDIHQAATAADRSPDAITPALFVTVRIDENPEHAHRATDDYARATYGMPLAELEKIQAVVTGTAAQVTERLNEYVTAGARHLVTRLAALDLPAHRDQMERTAALIPHLQP